MAPEEAMIEQARVMLRKHEGREMHRYKDNKGIWTIGTGFNLEQPGAREICQMVGADYDAIMADKASLTPEQDDQILNHFIITNVEWLTRIFPEFSEYSVPRQLALLDMSFMGEGKFRCFVHMISAILQGDWERAANEALNSKWALDVGQNRSRDVVCRLAEG